MRVFVTGANGWIGSAVVDELLQAGHTVAGLVRSAEKGARLAAAGGVPVVGDLGDLDAIRRAAEDADGIIHTAFGLDFADYARLSREDVKAIDTFGQVFAGSDRPIVVTSGLGRLPAGTVFAEDSRPAIDPDYPRASEQTAFALAERGIRASVVRPARAVHGPGERHGFVPMLVALARRTGVSAYIADGENGWPAVHRLDAARVFRLALERGGRGEAFHAVAECVPFRQVAEAIGRQAGVPAASLPPAEAEAHFGGLAVWLAGRGSVTSEQTRALLGWSPREIGLLPDIDRPGYHA